MQTNIDHFVISYENCQVICKNMFVFDLNFSVVEYCLSWRISICICSQWEQVSAMLCGCEVVLPVPPLFVPLIIVLCYLILLHGFSIQYVFFPCIKYCLLCVIDI